MFSYIDLYWDYPSLHEYGLPIERNRMTTQRMQVNMFVPVLFIYIDRQTLKKTYLSKVNLISMKLSCELIYIQQDR